MKRTGQLFDLILEYDNICLAVHKAARGKRDRKEAQAWLTDCNNKVQRMIEQLGSGKFSFGHYHQFRVYDPKERLITAPSFEERIVHHAIMNIVEPHLERWLISDTYACRLKKGRLRCLARAREFASTNAWFVKLDVRKYFDSISHCKLLELWQRKFKDTRLFHLFQRIIAAYQSGPGTGLPIGSLTSQHLANYYLSWLDRFVKEHLQVAGYVRYMDDMALWVADPAQARAVIQGVIEFLETELHLVPKVSPYANRTLHGMDFLGCRVYRSHVKLNRVSRVRIRRKWLKLNQDFQAGNLSESDFQHQATALTAFSRADGVSSWHFRQSLLQSEIGK